VTDLGRDGVERLRRSVARDLSAARRRFSCSAATHQRRTIIVVKTGATWRVREGYGLSSCLPDVDPDFVPSSSHPDPMPPADRPPGGFVRAYRTLTELRENRDRATPWHTPRLWLLWTADSGDQGEERRGAPWPAELPAPPELPLFGAGHSRPILQPVDGAYDDAVRGLIGLGALVEIDGRRWIVEVHREQPGDDAALCAWWHPARRCTPRTLR
jgi:hypothetical protein